MQIEVIAKMDWKNHPLLQVEENAEQQGKRPRVVDALCEYLTHLLYVNDSAPACATAGDALFAFESSEVPSISIRSYVERWHTYSCCSSACYVICYGWIKRLDLMQRITSRNIHRILLDSLVTACKLVDDIFMTQTFYARVGGIPVKELNCLEREFLYLLDYKLWSSEMFSNALMEMELDMEIAFDSFPAAATSEHLSKCASSREEGAFNFKKSSNFINV